MQELPGLPDWDRLLAESERYQFDDITVDGIARSTLIELKLRRGSGLDLAVIEAIQVLDRLDE